MQIFDKVLTSSSLETLLYLTILAVIMVMVLKILGIFRVNALIEINQIIHHILHKKIQLLSNQNLEYQLSKSLNKMSEILLNNGVFSLIDVFFSAGFLLVIFLINPWLALFALVALGILLLTEKYFNQKIKILNVKNSKIKTAENLNLAIAKNPNSSPIIIDENQYFQGIADFKKFSKYRNLTFKTNAFFLNIFKNTRLIISILTTSFSAILIIKNQISIGSLIAVSILISRFLEPFFAIEINIKNLQEFLQIYQNLLLKISQDLEVEKIDFQPKKFSQLNFRKILVQDKRSQTIEIENLEITKQNLIAFYCESNFQKNLLPNLLLHQIKPVVGIIEINGYDLGKINQNQIGKMLAIIDDNQLNYLGKISDFMCGFDLQKPDFIELLTSLKIFDEFKNMLAKNFAFEDLSITQKKLLLFLKKIATPHQIIFFDSPFGTSQIAKLLEILPKYCTQNHLTFIFYNPPLALRQYFDKIIIAKDGFINSFAVNELKKTP